MRRPLLAVVMSGHLLAWAAGCGVAESTVSGGKRLDGGTRDGGGGSTGNCIAMPEVCDGLDNDCDGVADNGFDNDQDGWSSCLEDCNDFDPAMHPGAVEILDSKDNDCDGKVDNRISGVDSDGDGYQYGTPTNGLPPDCNDDEPYVGPGAVEVAGDNTDNNCNGQVDEAVTGCDAAVSAGASSPGDFARAAEICGGITNSAFNAGSSSQARAVMASFGSSWVPKAGSRFFMLSTGHAREGSSGYVPQPGMDLGYSAADPASGTSVNDLTLLTLTLKAPQNARSFSFDFAFFSAEYPEFVGSAFNDRFVAVLTSQALPGQFKSAACAAAGESGCRQGNISFDGNGKEVSVNNSYFVVCQSDPQAPNAQCNPALVSQLAGTGYEKSDGLRPIGGGSGWLTTKAPVKPGETIQLQFAVLDEEDHIYDSSVLVDNFKWEAQSVQGPVTSPIN